MAANSDKTGAKRRRGGPGKPFSKDDPRINRKGRPPLPPELKEKWKLLHDEALERARELLHGDNPMVAARMVEVAIERHEGKVPTKLEHTGKDGGPISTADARNDLDGYTDEELEQLAAIERAREARRQAADAGGDSGGAAPPEA